jgi:hypothetical protein
VSLPDDDLARAFAALRRVEEEESPPFGRLWAAAGSAPGRAAGGAQTRPAASDSCAPSSTDPARSPLLLGLRWAAVAGAVLLSGWLMARRVPPPLYAPGPSLSEWRSPTAFLLRTPGRELLREPPALGRDYPLDTYR